MREFILHYSWVIGTRNAITAPGQKWLLTHLNLEQTETGVWKRDDSNFMGNSVLRILQSSVAISTWFVLSHSVIWCINQTQNYKNKIQEKCNWLPSDSQWMLNLQPISMIIVCYLFENSHSNAPFSAQKYHAGFFFFSHGKQVLMQKYTI